jgi:GntR family transcriptional regulator
MISIDLHGAVPLYRQIAETLRAQIRSGVYLPGQRLPTVRALGDRLGLNFNTVARAYRLLESEGEIVTRQGQGSFVEARGSAEGLLGGSSLEALTAEYLRAAEAAGFSPSQVQWEFSGALRAWMQYGAPPE